MNTNNEFAKALIKDMASNRAFYCRLNADEAIDHYKDYMLRKSTKKILTAKELEILTTDYLSLFQEDVDVIAEAILSL